jgi:hypothetical protein
VDTALDQARMPSVVPAVVALNSGMEGVVMSAAGGVAAVGSGGAAMGAGGGGGGGGDAAMGGGGDAAVIAGGDGVAVTRDDVMKQQGDAAARVAAGKGPAEAPGGAMEDITAPEVDAAM